MLSQVFHSYGNLARQMRGENYFQKYSLALEEFDCAYSQYLFYA